MALNLARHLIPLAQRVITAAELAALNSTPIVLASGADLADDEFLQFIFAEISYQPGTTPFTIGSATNFAIGYSGGASASGTVAATGLIDQTSVTGAMLQPVSGKVLAKTDLVLTLAGGNPSAGNGTLLVKMVYRDPAMRVLDDDF